MDATPFYSYIDEQLYLELISSAEYQTEMGDSEDRFHPERECA
jgi:hypothetical protein